MVLCNQLILVVNMCDVHVRGTTKVGNQLFDLSFPTASAALFALVWRGRASASLRTAARIAWFPRSPTTRLVARARLIGRRLVHILRHLIAQSLEVGHDPIFELCWPSF